MHPPQSCSSKTEGLPHLGHHCYALHGSFIVSSMDSPRYAVHNCSRRMTSTSDNPSSSLIGNEWSMYSYSSQVRLSGSRGGKIGSCSCSPPLGCESSWRPTAATNRTRQITAAAPSFLRFMVATRSLGYILKLLRLMRTLDARFRNGGMVWKT